MAHSDFYNAVSTYITLEAQDTEVLQSLFHYSTAAKGTTLIEAGKITDKVFFTISGYLRCFKILDTAEELIVHLVGPHCAITTPSSFFLETKSTETVQAITDCEFFYITKSDLEKLYAMDAKWQTLVRKLMESTIIEKEERIIDQISLTAHERYLKLIQKHPDIVQNVPVKYIASYIGIQPESLSRIRKTIEK